jgi:hypothetical protein
MTSYADIALPTDSKIATRLAWAGERIWDVAEGILSVEAGRYVETVIIGWSDLCSADDKAQYLALATQLNCLLAQ